MLFIMFYFHTFCGNLCVRLLTQNVGSVSQSMIFICLLLRNTKTVTDRSDAGAKAQTLKCSILSVNCHLKWTEKPTGCYCWLSVEFENLNAFGVLNS